MQHFADKKTLEDKSAYFQAEFEKILTMIEGESIRRFDSPPFDWKAYRSNMLSQVGSLSTVKDLFKALDVALKNLGDSHSFSMPPDVITRMNNNPSDFKQNNPTIEVKEGIGLIKIQTIC